MNISVLVPYRPDGGVRDFIFNKVLDRYNKVFPQIELCIGEDTSGHELFCRSSAINNAADKSTGDILILCDGDVIYNKYFFDDFAEKMGDLPYIHPFFRTFKLSENMSTKILSEELLKPPKRLSPSDVYEYTTIVTPQFMFAVKRDAFYRIGKMDEGFIGWGEEDRALMFMLRKTYGEVPRLKKTLYHIWHPEAQKDHSHRLENLDLLLRKYYYCQFEEETKDLEII